MNDEYQDLAYEMLGLSEDGHEIGTTRYIELPDDVFYAICATRLNDVYQELFDRRDEPRWDELVRTIAFLMEDDWLRAVKNKKYDPGYLQDPDHERRRNAIIAHEFVRLHAQHHYKPTFDRWREYVCDASPYFAKGLLVKELPIRVAEADCMRHLFVAASSGSGKSELCKIWCHAYRDHPEHGALFVFDPGGDFASQFVEAARTDRLIYIHPMLDLSRTPVINPFEIFGVNPNDTSDRAVAIKRAVSLQLVEILEEVIGEGQKGEVSKNMRTVLHPCILTLLDHPHATMWDLQLFMDDKRNPDLVSFGATRVHYPGVADFFRHSFRGETHIKPTKDAIKNKLYSLLTGGIFANLTCGKSTIHLERAWNERKVVVFNLPVGDMAQEANAFGRLVVALLQGIAKRRVNIPEEKRIPAHVIMDEMEFFLTPSMEELMRFSRRYKLIFLGVQQIVGSGMSADMQRAVLGNSYIKIAGWTDPKYAKGAAELLPVPDEAIASLEQGEFFIRVGSKPIFKFAIREDYLRSRQRMSEREWQAVRADQLKRYYRPIALPAPPSAPAALPEIIPPRPDKVIPYRQRDAAPPLQEVIPPNAIVRRKRTVKADRLEITEEDEGII
jgi:Helicase HerA, central domain